MPALISAPFFHLACRAEVTLYYISNIASHCRYKKYNDQNNVSLLAMFLVWSCSPASV